MKLPYYIVVNVVIHISRSKGVAEMTNKTNRIKKKRGALELEFDMVDKGKEKGTI